MLHATLLVTTLASAASVLGATAGTHEQFARAQDISVSRLTLSSKSLASQFNSTSIPKAQYSLDIAGKTSRRASKTAARATLGGPKQRFPLPYWTQLNGAGSDSEYLVNATIGGQHFSLITDTGSSDTWVVEKGFKCQTLESVPQPESECAFGSSGYSPTSTFKVLQGRNFNITYGDGEFLTGPAGFETVSIGGLTVPGQEIGLVNVAAWNGDSVNSGLLGLAFPNLTSVYKASDPSEDSNANREPYNPFFFTAVQQGRVLPFFSIALGRGSFKAQEDSLYDPGLGKLAFGGFAPVLVQQPIVTVPMDVYQTRHSGSGYYYYIADVQSYSFPGSSKVPTANNRTILDTGTTLTYIPTDVMTAYAATFSPPAKYDDDFGLYLVNCNAKAPPFKVQIGGRYFSIDAKDQILPTGSKDNKGNEICFTGIQDGGADTPDNVFILGDVFLHNVVVTFDIKRHLVTLAQRPSY